MTRHFTDLKSEYDPVSNENFIVWSQPNHSFLERDDMSVPVTVPVPVPAPQYISNSYKQYTTYQNNFENNDIGIDSFTVPYDPYDYSNERDFDPFPIASVVPEVNRDFIPPKHVTKSDRSYFTPPLPVMVNPKPTPKPTPSPSPSPKHVMKSDRSYFTPPVMVNPKPKPEPKLKSSPLPSPYVVKPPTSNLVPLPNKLKQVSTSKPKTTSTKDSEPCCVCFEPLEQRMVLIPCGHTTVCENCLEEINNKCPLCMQKIQSFYKIYI